MILILNSFKVAEPEQESAGEEDETEGLDGVVEQMPKTKWEIAAPTVKLPYCSDMYPTRCMPNMPHILFLVFHLR